MPVCYIKLNINEILTVGCKFGNLESHSRFLHRRLQYIAGIGEGTENKNR